MLHTVSRRAFLHTLGIGSVSLVANCGPSESRPFCWRLWRGQVAVDSRTRSVMVRAVDSRGLEQPRTVEWNLKGYLFNAWDRVPLRSI